MLIYYYTLYNDTDVDKLFIIMMTHTYYIGTMYNIHNNIVKVHYIRYNK